MWSLLLILLLMALPAWAEQTFEITGRDVYGPRLHEELASGLSLPARQIRVETGPQYAKIRVPDAASPAAVQAILRAHVARPTSAEEAEAARPPLMTDAEIDSLVETTWAGESPERLAALKALYRHVRALDPRSRASR